MTWKDLVEGGFVIAGSPDTVRERMLEMIGGLRVGNVFCLLHMGDMPDEKTRHSTRLFAERVMPAIRDVWADWKDDARFWIKPLAAEQRRAPAPRRFRVSAPLLPGYEDSEGADRLRTMLDFTLWGFDVVEALGLEHPLLVGHSLGGMIAAEMAAVCPRDVPGLALIAPLGLWLEDHPLPDLFWLLPFELPPLLFHDPPSRRSS